MSDFASDGGHWYMPDGSPFYTYTNRNGEEKNVTLRQARPVGAYPSLTGIMDIKSKPNLIRWIKKQVVFMCDQAPKLPDETCEHWAERVLRLYDSEGAAKRALDTGSEIHTAIERKLLGKEYDQFYAKHVYGALEAIEMWCGLEGGAIERSASHPMGYGCRVDWHKPGFVIDYKGKEFDESWAPEVYDSHWMQLAACREALEMPKARGAILYVSRNNPGLVRLVEVPQSQLSHGWEMFKKCFELWCLDRNYHPTERKETCNG
jgi:hypothetical protein